MQIKMIKVSPSSAENALWGFIALAMSCQHLARKEGLPKQQVSTRLLVASVDRVIHHLVTCANLAERAETHSNPKLVMDFARKDVQ